MDEKLYIKAINYLTRRPHSEKEVRDNLFKPYFRLKLPEEQKKEIQEKIRIVLDNLKRQRYVNDVEFAQWWIEQRSRFKPKGWRVIEMELKQKGIEKEIIQEARKTDITTSLPGEKEQALQIIAKRMKKYEGLTRNELYQKLGGFLARRGFDLDIIRSCIDEVIKKSV